MNEKKLYISRLFDYYGALLSEKQQYAVEMYYNDDLSLSEIAESIGITRQGVRDQLKHAEEYMIACESKLGFASKLSRALEISEEILSICEKSDEPYSGEISEKCSKVIELLS